MASGVSYRRATSPVSVLTPSYVCRSMSAATPPRERPVGYLVPQDGVRRQLWEDDGSIWRQPEAGTSTASTTHQPRVPTTYAQGCSVTPPTCRPAPQVAPISLWTPPMSGAGHLA